MLANRLFHAFVCLLACSATTLGQTQDSRHRVDVFAGFSNVQSLNTCCSPNASGWHVGLGYRPIEILGMSVEYNEVYGPQKNGIRNLHFGPLLRVTHGVFAPFARALFGYTEDRNIFEGRYAQHTRIDRDFSAAIGGGVDIRTASRLAVRVLFDGIRESERWDTRGGLGIVIAVR